MDVRSSGIYGGKGGSDYPVIRNSEEELRGINNKLSFSAKLKLLKAKIMYLAVYNDDNDNNNNNNNKRHYKKVILATAHVLWLFKHSLMWF
jgi:hypothetical protein